MEQTWPGAFLHSLYRRYVGPVRDSRDLYAGFGIFFTGVGLVVVSIAAFLWSTTLSPSGTFKFVVRELAVTTGACGLPLVLFGITVLLPVSRRIDAAAAAGVAACVIAAARFTQIYPQAWYTYSSTVVGLYALGAVVVVATAGTALSGYRVERATVRTESELSGEAKAEESRGESEAAERTTITDEQVRRDIEDAMDGAEINWGGVERDSGRTLTLTDSSLDTDEIGLENAAAKESRGGSVDDAVEGLQGLRGGQRKTATSESDTSDQANALAELRAEQRKREEQKRQKEPDSVIDKLRDRFL
ncbi:MAG: hypothetical protein ABEI27_05800 [Halobellus sp.]|uniref:DUF7139 domain-containing protein n=1 Tax=Halobellus sp. TaxID=1979212 RepID=UPI0035D3DA8B